MAPTAYLEPLILTAIRLSPTLAFAPPFTLVRLPAVIRGVVILSLAAAMTAGMEAQDLDLAVQAPFAAAATTELAVGLAVALPLQLAFAMIAVAGRALDIQAGFGLAFLIDPTTRAQTPLVGALFTYAAGAIFFSTGGASNLLLAIARANQLLPVGSVAYDPDLQALLLFLSTISVMAVGAVGLLLTVLFLIDLTVALLSRTLPQMNVLVLGFQIKAFTTLVLLPVTIGLSASLIAQILSLAVDLVPRLA